VAGSFARDGDAGPDRFTFTGRLLDRARRPGLYRLVATPTVAGRTSAKARARFRVRR
jgi:hypothetical protein